MVGWHHQVDGHEFEQAWGVGDGQGRLVCCSPWHCRESDKTEQLNWTEHCYHKRFSDFFFNFWVFNRSLWLLILQLSKFLLNMNIYVQLILLNEIWGLWASGLKQLSGSIPAPSSYSKWTEFPSALLLLSLLLPMWPQHSPLLQQLVWWGIREATDRRKIKAL